MSGFPLSTEIVCLLPPYYIRDYNMKNHFLTLLIQLASLNFLLLAVSAKNGDALITHDAQYPKMLAEIDCPRSILSRCLLISYSMSIINYLPLVCYYAKWFASNPSSTIGIDGLEIFFNPNNGVSHHAANVNWYIRFGWTTVINSQPTFRSWW